MARRRVGKNEGEGNNKDIKWDTSIWFDSKEENYILPVKSEIRKKLTLEEDDILTISILV